MKQHVSLEMKVGAFIVAGVALLIVFLFTIGDVATYFQPGYGLAVVFDSANGISRGAPVRYAGVEVGKVSEIQLLPRDHASSQVELAIRLPRKVRIHADDEAIISTFGLLGEKYLEIRPGPGAGAALQPGERLIGKSPVSTERIVERSNEVLTEFKQTLEGLNSLVGDPQARIYLKEMAQESRDAVRYWKLLGERLNMALTQAEGGHGNVGKMLYDEELYQRLVAFAADIQAHPWKLLIRTKDQK